MFRIGCGAHEEEKAKPKKEEKPVEKTTEKPKVGV
jgi:hypothetical protein